MTAPLIHLAEHGALTDDERRLIHRTVRNGGLIVFPTDTIYGLGCDAFQSGAIDRIYRLKDRRSDQSLSVHLKSVQELGRYAEIGDDQWARIERLLPGPYTVILTATRDAPPRCTGPDGRIGLRVPEGSAYRAVSEAAGCPLVGTSVNRSGEPPLNDIGVIREQFGDELDLILASDTPLSGTGSTVIDLTVEPPVALRGELPREL